MEEDFDYQSVPARYAHCFNSECLQSRDCLRHLVAKCCTSQYPTLPIINPNCIPTDSAACPYFRSAKKLHVAWGISQLLENVPHKDAHSLRLQLIAHFGKTNYYQWYRQERPLLPKEQAYIREVFRQKGIVEEPQFCRYSDEYYYG